MLSGWSDFWLESVPTFDCSASLFKHKFGKKKYFEICVKAGTYSVDV